MSDVAVVGPSLLSSLACSLLCVSITLHLMLLRSSGGRQTKLRTSGGLLPPPARARPSACVGGIMPTISPTATASKLRFCAERGVPCSTCLPSSKSSHHRHHPTHQSGFHQSRRPPSLTLCRVPALERSSNCRASRASAGLRAAITTATTMAKVYTLGASSKIVLAMSASGFEHASSKIGLAMCECIHAMKILYKQRKSFFGCSQSPVCLPSQPPLNSIKTLAINRVCKKLAVVGQ